MKKFTLFLFALISLTTLSKEMQIRDKSSGKKKIDSFIQKTKKVDLILPAILENAISVKLKEGAGDFGKQTGMVNFGILSLDEKVSMFDVHQLEKRFRYNPEKLKAGLPDLSRIYKISYNGPYSAVFVAEVFSRDPHVEYAEPIPIDYPDDIPDDALYTLCQHLPQIMAPNAWDIFHGEDGPPVVIAIIDNGVDWKHNDLRLNIWQNLGEDANGNGRTLEFINGEWVFDPGDLNNIDNDGNGYVDDLIGWDIVLNNNNPNHNWGENHGTHCAGIAAGVTNNQQGISSISWNVKVMPLQVAQSDGLFVGAYDGIIYAAENGADIISNSWSGSTPSQANQEVITYATQQGSIILASAGNYNSLNKRYPASYVDVISVAAVSMNDIKTSYSSFGSTVDIAAPGGGTEGGILSTLPNNQYGRLSGTSMACPLTAGCFGLLKAYHPEWTNEQLITQVLGTADDIDNINPAHANLLGTGRVNAYRFMSEENVQMPQKLKLELVAASYNDANGNNVNEPGEQISMNLQFRNFVPYLGEKGVTVTLTSNDPDIIVLQGNATVDIPPDGIFSIENAFLFLVSENATSHFASLTVSLDAETEIVSGAVNNVNVLVAPSGIFVFEGVDNGRDYSGTFFRQILDQLAIPYIYANEYPPTLLGFDHVFASHANFGQNLDRGTMFTEVHSLMYQEYLENGGNLYLEAGGAFMGMMYFGYSNYAAMKQLFGISSNQLSLTQNPIDLLIGVANSPFAGITFNQSNQLLNWYIDKLTPVASAVIPFYENNYGNVSIMFDGSASYGHKIFYLSYSLAELVDADVTNSKNNVFLKILKYFDLLDEGYLLAAFKSDKIAGGTPLEVQFTDLSLSDNGFPIISWQWDFNNDGIIDSQEQHPVWIFTEPGEHDISLTITNASDSHTIIKPGFITVNDGCLVFEGMAGGNDYSGTFIKSFLEENAAWLSTYRNVLPADLNGYKAVFLSFGNYDSENTVLDDEMANILTNYLQNGGFVYVEGGDPFGWDQSTNSNLLGLFGLASALDGTLNAIDLLEGQAGSLTDGITFTSSIQPAFGYIDIYVPDNQSKSAFFESDYGIVAVQNTGIHNQRTFCFSYALASLADGEHPNTRTELLQRICNFFEIPINPTSVDAYDSKSKNALGDVTIFPNPFTNYTSIRFNIKAACNVKMEVYNSLGQKIGAFIDERFTEGTHETFWNISNIKQGIYLLHLQAGDETITRKIIKY